ncbi:MAG TPA: chloride channel protein [Azospirillum sp.]|nr:chloride channel protein [Azospirillum sp.]
MSKLAPSLLIGARRVLRNDQLLVIGLALVAGGAAALGAVLFRQGIGVVQSLAFGFSSERVHSLAAALPWWRVLLAPALGGLVVGLMVHVLLPERRPQGVPQVIVANARHGGRLPLGSGLAAALVSMVSLGCGGSAGREGPVVHLGATLASWLAGIIRLPSALRRTLLGCGVAAAVAASFNAPIAGVFFALEVVVGQYTLSTLAPVMLASVVGTGVGRAVYGDFPAFVLPHYATGALAELPAFALLGLAAGMVAMLFMRVTFALEDRTGRLPLPRWLLPALGGVLVGAIALRYPHVLGVGYEATDDVLQGRLAAGLMAELLVAKLAATAVTLAFGFGGGLFSPALVLGAMTGGLAATAAASLIPGTASAHPVYVLAGMGAVAAPVLGAPISTILIVFEMSGDYAVTLAVMVAVIASSGLVHGLVAHSFFTWQLARRGIELRPPQAVGRLASATVADIMVEEPADALAGPFLDPDTSLSEALRRFEEAGLDRLPVRASDGRLLGVVHERALLRASVHALTHDGR